MVIKKKNEISISDAIDKINQILKEGEPNNISVDPYTHYSGYAPQSVIDAMNSALGTDGWGFNDISSELVLGTSDGKEAPVLVVSQIEAWIGNSKRTAYGQGRITRGDIGDGKKSAQTDGLKKALSYFSIGNRAYLGLLDVNAPAPVATTNNYEKEPEMHEPEVKRPTNAPSESNVKMYFLVAKAAGFDGEKAKNAAKMQFKLASFNDISKEQLQAMTSAMSKKANGKKKEQEKEIDISEFDGKVE